MCHITSASGSFLKMPLSPMGYQTKELLWAIGSLPQAYRPVPWTANFVDGETLINSPLFNVIRCIDTRCSGWPPFHSMALSDSGKASF